MNNIITAIINLAKDTKVQLKKYAHSHNRANNMGEALEEYIKDIFADTVNELDECKRNKKLSSTFCYLGNQNNPPDMMLKNGDAIEVKKIESIDSSLALNSSYPKAKLYADSLMISKECKCCEQWKVRDMIYAVGVVKDDTLKALTMVYGDIYCADQDIYERIRNKIKDGVTTIPDVEFSETKELGRVNRVDPLGITYLRIRGMWGIENPLKVFDYTHKIDKNKKFNFLCIISENKFNSFENRGDLISYVKTDSRIQLKDVNIKNPNNPAKLIKAKLIHFSIV